MKKTRKVLSIVLALVMIFSTVSAALVSFASDEKPASVKAFEDMVSNAPANGTIGTRYNKPDPADYADGENDAKYIKDLAKYDESVTALNWLNDTAAAYKALPEGEKDQIDPALLFKFLDKYQANGGLEIRESGATSDANTSKQMAAEKFDETLGTHKARSEAFALMKIIGENPIDAAGKQFLTSSTNFKTYPQANEVFAKLLDATEKASPLARTYAGFFYNSKGVIYVYAILGKPYKFVADVTNMFFKQAQANNVYDVTAPARIAKPVAGNFDTPEEFEAAYAEYLDKELAYYQWKSESDYNYAADFAVENVAAFYAKCDELKALGECFKVIYKEADEFIKANDGKGCKEAVDMFEALTPAQQDIFNALTSSVYQYAYVNGTGTSATVKTNTISPKKMLDEARNAADMVYVAQFEEYMATIDLDKITNETVVEAFNNYNAVPSGVRGKISPEVMEKYNAVRALYVPVGPNDPSKDIFEDYLANYKKTNVKTPINPVFWKKDGVKNLVNPLLDFFFNAEDALTTGVYTNYAVGEILKLYDIIYNATLEVEILPGLPVNIATLLGGEGAPSKMKDFLFEEKYAVAVEKMLAAVEAGKAAGGDFHETAAYNDIHWDNGDFGFQDGDREGFINAVLAVLRPVTKLLSEDGKILIPIDVQMTDYTETAEPHAGDYRYGLYARLVPALEGLGLNIPNSQDYTAAVKAARAQNKNLGYDALLRPILEAVSNDILAPIEKDPFTAVMNLAVRLADTVGSGKLDACVKDALSTNGGKLAGVAGALDLSADGINNMLTAAPISIPVDEATMITLKLKPINWAELANCADVKLTHSNSHMNAFRIERTADINRAFSHMFYYIYDVVFADADNYASVRSALVTMEGGNEIVKFTDKMEKIGAVRSYGLVLNTAVLLNFVVSLLNIILGK